MWNRCGNMFKNKDTLLYKLLEINKQTSACQVQSVIVRVSKLQPVSGYIWISQQFVAGLIYQETTTHTCSHTC